MVLEDRYASVTAAPPGGGDGGRVLVAVLQYNGWWLVDGCGW